MSFFGAIEDKIEKQTDRTMTYVLIGTAIVLVLVALFVKNRWFKSSILAWVLLP